MIGYVDVGGGMRDIYGAGVLDRCMDDGVDFPYLIGVSAGSANIASFVAGQKERCMRFYCDYAFRPEYMSFYNFVSHKSFVGLDYIYSTLSNHDGEDPVDYEKFMAKVTTTSKFLVVATDAQTGKAVYFDAKDIEPDNYFALKASCCIPIACPPQIKDGKAYFDGGVANPIPIRKAFEDGCDKVVLTLTRPVDYIKKHWFSQDVYDKFLKEYPEVSKDIVESSEKYNRDLEYAKELEKEGKVLIIAPDNCCHVETLIKRKRDVKALYKKGYEDAKKIKEFVNTP